MLALLGERERALIDPAAGFSGDGGDFGDGLLDRKTLERLTQQRIEIGRSHLGLPIGRRHDDHDLAPRLLRLRRRAREYAEVAAPDFFVKLCELAVDRGLARTKLRGKVRERRGNTRAGLEQNERSWNAFELVDAPPPPPFLPWQESPQQEPVGAKPAQRKRCEHRPA